MPTSGNIIFDKCIQNGVLTGSTVWWFEERNEVSGTEHYEDGRPVGAGHGGIGVTSRRVQARWRQVRQRDSRDLSLLWHNSRISRRSSRRGRHAATP